MNIQHPKKLISLHIADAYLLSSDINVTYMTGFSGDSSQLLIIGDRLTFFTDSRYTEQAKKDLGSHIEIITTNATERLPSIERILSTENVSTLAIEKEHMTLFDFEEMNRIFGLCDYIDMSSELLQMRSIKTKDEIKKIKIAAKGNERVLQALETTIQSGMTEMDIRAELLYQIHKQGMDSAFTPIVASGENSALPHATVTDRTIRDGDFLTLDFGCRYQGYCSDITRTFGIGSIDARQKNIYDIVYHAQQSALEKAVTCNSAKEIDLVARNVISDHGYGMYYQHGTGHGVGLQIHELPVLNPNSSDIIKEAMVYTIEPGIYIPDFGGVRIEDMCIAGEGSLYEYPKELIILK